MTQPWLRLDLSAVERNVAAWRAVLTGREVWAVVKSDAYGCGAVDVARASLRGGAARLVVFDVDEARPLRAAGIKSPIVQVFATRGSALTAAVSLGVTPSIEDEAGARDLSALADWRARRLPVHIAIDTGTGWSGVPAARAAEFARAVAPLPGIVWEGAWTHIAGKDSMDAQMRAFAGAVAALRENGLDVRVTHAASTGPALWGRSTGAARVGIGLYGVTLSEAEIRPALAEAVDVRARVIACKTFDSATPLGYGSEDVAQAGESIATLRIGYADGLPKTLGSGAGSVSLRGVQCAIAGAIGMNCTMVRVPKGTPVAEGDEAVIVGGLPGLHLEDVAAAAQTVPHALLCSLTRGMRVERASGLA